MRAIKNFFLLLISEGLSYILNFLTTVYLARILKVTEFGKINFAFAFFAFSSIFTNLGLLSVGTRDIAQFQVSIPKKSEAQYIINLLSLRLLIALVVFGVLSIISRIIPSSLEIKTLIVLYGLSLFPLSLSLEWVFLGWEKAGYIMSSKIVTAVSYFLLTITLIKDPTAINRIPLFFFLSNLLGAGFLLITYLQHNITPNINFEFTIWLKDWMQLIKTALPFGLGALLVQFSLNFNVIFLGFVKNSTEVGFYSASFKVLTFLLIFDRVINNTTLPIISRYAQLGEEKLLFLINKINKLIFIIGLPLAAIVLVLNRELILFIYGENYLRSAQIIQVLIWFLLITMLNSIFTTVVIAQNEQRIYITTMIQGLIANLILNLILVPLLGALGSAIVLVTQELIILSLFYIKTKIITSLKIYWQNLYKPLMAASLMTIFMFLLKKFNFVLIIGLALLFYLGILVIIKGITKKDFLLQET
ncbi:MAG: flippase [candidate division WOR-3 bacterium]